MAVDTEDLINSAIDARAARDAQRQQIAQRRDQITRQLANISTGRRSRGQIASLQSELANLGATERNLHHQDNADQANVALRANTAFRNAHLAQNEAKLNRDADVATAAANIQNGLARLQQKYPNRILDSNQANAFHKELSDLRDANPLGLRNESTAAMLRQATTFHDQERNRVVNKLQDTLFKQSGGMSPEQFISGLETARASNVPLKNPDGTVPNKDQIEKNRADNGQSVAMEVNGVTKLFDRALFDNLKNTFAPQPSTQVATVPSEPNSDIQPIVPTYGGQGATPPGGLVRNYDGSISPIVPTYGGEGAAPPNALVRTGVAQIGTPPPTGVPPDQQIGQPPTPPPVTQVQVPMSAESPTNVVTNNVPQSTPAPQVSAQATVDPRTALAQKALDDPNATEAHKAAARQILGIQ